MFQWLRDVLSGAFEGRSPQWPTVRRDHLNHEPQCQVCGTIDDLEVHHLVPFHTQPELELDPKNLITLCRPHHHLVGHLMNWSSYNPNCQADAANWRRKIRERPRCLAYLN